MATATAKTTTTKTADQLRAEITEQLMAAIKAPKAKISLTDRLLQYGADKIADAGNGVAELMAGFEAAGDNYSVHKEAARQRQAVRTARKIDGLVAAEMKARGLE